MVQMYEMNFGAVCGIKIFEQIKGVLLHNLNFS